MTAVVNKYKEPYDVYIGRGSKWGNPFTHRPVETTKAEFQCETREESIMRYRDYVLGNKELLNSLHELEGKRLGCFCKPKDCHGDILVELVESKLTIRGNSNAN